jgi:hypothetical protein
VAATDPLCVVVASVGYSTARFDLPENAPSVLSILRLEPAPIELEGVEVVAEGAVTRVFRELARRRRAYFGSVRAFDQTQLERRARLGSVWHFVRRMASSCMSATTR